MLCLGWAGTGGAGALRLEERKIAVRDLKVGMYVCRLDRDWAGTPFALQGLPIDSQDEIDALGRYCEHVYIDIELGLAPPDAPLLGLLPRDRQHGHRDQRMVREEYDDRSVRKLQNKITYGNTIAFDEELPRAKEVQYKVAEFASRILDDVREGRSISVDDVHVAIKPMVDSVLRNMDAFMWIESLRKNDGYDYSHALNCSALAAAFGRHLGFPEDVLLDLASGGLLLDVGKLRVPAALLACTGPLDADEMVQVRRHVEHGLSVLAGGGGLPASISDMIRTHHERIDGHGYPAGLAEDQIPLLGKIAAVIDAYDAMTSKRVYRNAISRHDALQELYRNRNKLYAAEIVEQFMQCLGVYPTGSLVELSNGCAAIVMAQNPARRLFPRVMVLTSPDKQLETHFVALDLMRLSEQDKAKGIRIVQTLEPGAHGLDPTELYL